MKKPYCLVNMLQGAINLYGLAYLMGALGAFLWRARIKRTSPDSPNSDLWMKILLYTSIFVFFLGSTFWVDNPVWFRTTLIIAHAFMIPSMYYISKMWWRLWVREMPKWWGRAIVGIILVFLIAEIYYAFRGYLPHSYNVGGPFTVLIRNDHPLVAWLFIPAVWASLWPMGFVFWRQGILAHGAKVKARLFAFGAAWILGSSLTVYSNFVVDPHKILRGNLVLLVTFTALIIAASIKPKPKTEPTTTAQTT